ncbi:MAG: endolytic transglycosylase MltG [Nitrosomonadales bacterium]|nr:endolytic transglycosylase MltG [Nitrosomonadales bacterium]
MIKRLFVLLLLLAVAVGYYALTPLNLPATPFEFTLKSGSSLKGAARQMQQVGLLQQGWAFAWMGRALGKSGQIKAGSYELSEPVTPLRLLEIISKGEVSMMQLSVIEGWSFSQLRAALNAHPDVMHDTATLSEVEILQRIGATELQAEGLFFPDTYYFNKGDSDLAILRRAYRTMQNALSEQWQARDEGLPLRDIYQALTLASIVEKETGAEADRGMIAAVFENRLRRGMLLQTDPTVIYGLGERFDGNLRKSDLLTDTPYNTYTRGGLPPTPIALPGKAALQAVLHPPKTQALYFVARGDGSSVFSSTLEEHNRAVYRYQKSHR